MASKAFGKLASTQPHYRTASPAPLAVSTPQVFSPAAAGIDAKTYSNILGADSQNADPSHFGSSVTRTGKPVKWLRFTSGLMDTCVMGFIWYIFYIMNGGGTATATFEVAAINAFLLTLPFGLAYGIILEVSALQGTLGKVATGTVVTDKNGDRISLGRAVGRNIGKIISSFMPFYIAYSMVIFTENRQSLHDLMSGTLVFRKGDGPHQATSVFD